MEPPQEHGSKETTTSKREWMVEYEVTDKEGRKQKHLSLLRGKGIPEVQASLFKELRETYPTQSTIEVTITRFEPVSTQTDLRCINPAIGFTA